MSDQEILNDRYKKMKWTFLKVMLTLILFAGGVLCILIGVNPLIDLDFELKSFCNLLFVTFHIFYLGSFIAVKKNSEYIFWASSYILLIVTSIMFYYYDDIFV